MGEDVNAADADVELQRMFRQAGSLGESERKILNDMLASLLKNKPSHSN